MRCTHAPSHVLIFLAAGIASQSASKRGADFCGTDAGTGSLTGALAAVDADAAAVRLTFGAFTGLKEARVQKILPRRLLCCTHASTVSGVSGMNARQTPRSLAADVQVPHLTSCCAFKPSAHTATIACTLSRQLVALNDHTLALSFSAGVAARRLVVQPGQRSTCFLNALLHTPVRCTEGFSKSYIFFAEGGLASTTVRSSSNFCLASFSAFCALSLFGMQSSMASGSIPSVMHSHSRLARHSAGVIMLA